MATAAILGCAGYTGQETLDRLLAHPELEPIALGSDSLAGRRRVGARPAAERRACRRSSPNAEALAAGADVVFLCLGHEAAAAIEPPDADVVIDLSGAHRLRDASLYAEWYGFEHPRPGAWSYGLPELFAPRAAARREPRLLRHRGAARARAARRRRSSTASVVVDAKSGVSGAGRGLKASSHAGFVLENLTPYRVGDAPARAGDRAGARLPGLLRAAPAARAARAARRRVTCSRTRTLRALLEDAYADAPAVRVLARGRRARAVARAAHGRRRDRLYEDRATGRTIVVCAIDNLGKGAAGNAVQNANVALGLDETAGLRLAGVLV